MSSLTQSGFVTSRAMQYAQTGPAPQPKVFCLVGAKLAISHDDLEACHEGGKPEYEVTAALNQLWRSKNAERIKSQETWISEGYLPALDRLREARAVAQAALLERQAAIERLTSDDA